MKKLSACEICGFSGKALHAHHMIPRTDPNCTDDFANLATLCANCHNEVHAHEKIIEGRFLTTAGYQLFWHKKNEKPIIREGIILLDDGTAIIKQ